jgi:hypothetical protein
VTQSNSNLQPGYSVVAERGACGHARRLLAGTLLPALRVAPDERVLLGATAELPGMRPGSDGRPLEDL